MFPRMPWPADFTTGVTQVIVAQLFPNTVLQNRWLDISNFRLCSPQILITWFCNDCEVISSDVDQLFRAIGARTQAVGTNFLPSRHVHRLLYVRAVLIFASALIMLMRTLHGN